jgi:ATP-binding cassette, subfamily C, bacterial CydC
MSEGVRDGGSDLRRVLAAMRPDPWRVLLAAVTGAAALSASVALLGTSGWLISRAAQQPPVLYLMVAVVAVRAFGIGRGVLRYAERLVSHDVALRGVVQLRETLYTRLAHADGAVVAGLRRGDLLARIGSDADELSDVVVRSILPFTTAVIACAAGSLAVALILPAAGVVLLAALLVALVAAPALAALAARRAIVQTTSARTAMSAQVLALLDGLPELAVAGAVDGRLAAVRDADAQLAHGLDRAARPASWASAVSTAAMAAAMLSCLVTGTAAVHDGRVAPVMLAVLVLIPMALAEVVGPLPAAAAGLVRAGVAASRIAELLDAPPARTASSTARGRQHDRESAAGAAADAATEVGVLQARGLACGWPGRGAVLAGVDLDLAPGRRIAIAGPSGAGKSTLLATLAGLIPPIAGEVCLDGAALGQLDPADVRRAILLTADDAHVFTTTVRENIRVARPGASDDLVRAALESAGLDRWVRSLPAGLDTVVRDPSGPPAGGAAQVLSGGERRRLLVARALASRAGILLVDEPAEHLDGAAADALVAAVFGSGRAAVVVTHRLTPLALADEVLVVDEGRVAARGSHDELIAGYPPYRDAWMAEAGELAR